MTKCARKKQGHKYDTGRNIYPAGLTQLIYLLQKFCSYVSHDLLIAKKMWFILAIVIVINKIYFAILFNIIVE